MLRTRPDSEVHLIPFSSPGTIFSNRPLVRLSSNVSQTSETTVRAPPTPSYRNTGGRCQQRDVECAMSQTAALVRDLGMNSCTRTLVSVQRGPTTGKEGNWGNGHFIASRTTGAAASSTIRQSYISGGRTCPDGTLPGASRPPVGRTRGGQHHPRPLYRVPESTFFG